MKEQYDFFGMGERYAKEGLFNLKKMADELGQKYGLDAKLEFESGIANFIPSYQNIDSIMLSEKDVTEKDIKYSTTNYGDTESYNRSYEGGHGATRKH